MKRRLFAALVLAAGFAAAPARADDAAAMAAVADSFYATYAALPHTGGIPDANARARYAPLFSPRLNKLLADAAAAEARFQAKNKDAPPLMEGDLFSSLFEGITSYKLGACSGDGKSGHCDARLAHADPKKPVSWSDSVMLVNTASGWKIDDLAYKAGFQFGNSGTLDETLAMVAGFGP